MRILHTESSCGWGGQEIRILEEARGMSARGHEVTLIAPREARIYDAALERGLDAAALPIGRKNIRGLLAVRRWLKARPVEVINTHSSTDSWLAALACATLARPPAIVRTRHVSSSIPNNLPTRWLYRTATRLIVTTGESLRAQLVRDNGLPAERIASVPTGIDTARFVPGSREAARKATGLPPDRPSRGHRRDSAKLERASLSDRSRESPSWRDWAGYRRRRTSAGKHQLESQRVGMRERVFLAGNQADVLPWLRSLDVFALPSYANEGVPQALVQAMLCGLPCVTTAAGAITEVARDLETALIVQKEDAADLKRGMERLFGDPGLRARLGAAARAYCVAHYSFETMLDRMEAVFRSVARG